MDNNLIPEARVNKNGVTAIKYVRPDKPESLSLRNMPFPSITPAPVPFETERERPDYDQIIQNNTDFFLRSDSVLMTPTDLVAYSDLLDYASKRNDDGDDKTWALGQLLKAGNTGAVKTILTHIENHQTNNISYDHHGNVFEAWNYGCDAGIFEQGKDYSANIEDQKFFDFIVKTFEASDDDHAMNETDAETIQRVADIYRSLDGNVDPGSLAGYWEDRDELDGYLEYAAEHNATRDGVL